MDVNDLNLYALLHMFYVQQLGIGQDSFRGVANLKENVKDTRGFHNPFTRFLLTGPDIDLSNADVIADMQANKWKSNPDDLLVQFLLANFEIDSDDICTGFLRSELLVHAYKAIFFGPQIFPTNATNAMAQLAMSAFERLKLQHATRKASLLQNQNRGNGPTVPGSSNGTAAQPTAASQSALAAAAAA
ncbi:hypothetical protein M422DRAFT_253719 [Sphaerobolus stellatus SS14]|uniref:Uncharacterized protein n=1 Tax=Sphaerobolus stellatus (strain SS14) TaxID=990650 RepID=A0A0C9VMB8_SPHS4|nr:hypothetical protein M422DRAFT_253719 [Sphaerobolus stellatus SS14]